MVYRYPLKIALAAIAALSLASPIFAADLVIYDQPNANAKVVGKINLSSGVMPIYTPPNSEWLKVADPSNGNVGWAKQADLSALGKTGIYFTQKIINDGNADARTYQIFQYGTPPAANQNERQVMLKKFQLQQQAIQKEMQSNMQDMVRNMNLLYQQQWELMKSTPYPLMAPPHIIIVQPQVAKDSRQPTTQPMQTSVPKPAQAPTPVKPPAPTATKPSTQ